MSDTPRVLFVVCLLFGGIALGGTVFATDGYSLNMDSTVEVPEETIQNPEDDSSEFTVSQVGVSSPGDSVTIAATPPDGQSYFVFLRDEDGDLITRTDQLSEPQTVDLDATGEPAGSYVVTIGPDSTPEEILPVVIEAYRLQTVSVGSTESSPGGSFEIDGDESVDVSVTLDEVESQPISNVSLTLWNEDTGTAEVVSLTEREELVYGGTLSAVDPGTYNVQLRVHGGSQVESGTFELIGLSENSQLTVTEPPNDEGGSDDDNDNNGGSDDTGSSGDGPADDDEGVENSTDTGDDGDISDETNETSENDTSTNGTGSDNLSDPDNQTSDQSGDDVITPNTEDDESSNTDESVPVYAVPIALLLLVIGGASRRLLTSSPR